VVQVGSQKYRRTFKKYIFTFNLLPNLAKSSYGSSPLWLNHKINKKKHSGREAGREIGRKEGRNKMKGREEGKERERERERERGQDWRSCRFMGA
jgi:hypothetical protein